MELGQAGVRDAQLDARDRALDRVDVLPVDVALGQRQVEPAGERPVRTLRGPAVGAGRRRRRRPPRGAGCLRPRRA